MSVLPPWPGPVRPEGAERLRYTLVRDGHMYEFVWTGGPYIEVSVDGSAPFEVINVWDYETGRRSIPYTMDALEGRAQEWYEEAEAEGNIPSYITEARYYMRRN